MEDFDIVIPPSEVYVSERTSRVIDIPITGTIQSPEYYNDMVYMLRNAQPEDEVNILINSWGGVVDGALHIVSGIQSCPAHSITASITGACGSAATYIFFACTQWEIPPYAGMLIHTSSYGAGYAPTPHQLDLAKYEATHNQGVHDIFYKGFLSEQELLAVADSKQMYFTADEILERLNNRAKYLQEEQSEDFEDVDECFDFSGVKASPAAKSLALENELDLMEVKGSGSGGMITKKDVIDYLATL